MLKGNNTGNVLLAFVAAYCRCFGLAHAQNKPIEWHKHAVTFKTA